MFTTEHQGLLDTSDFFRFSCSALAFVLYLTVVSHFSVNNSLVVSNGKFGENTEPAVRRLRRNEPILVSEVISSVSYAPVQMEQMSLVWRVGAKRENNRYESHPWHIFYSHYCGE